MKILSGNYGKRGLDGERGRVRHGAVEHARRQRRGLPQASGEDVDRGGRRIHDRETKSRFKRITQEQRKEDTESEGGKGSNRPGIRACRGL